MAGWLLFCVCTGLTTLTLVAVAEEPRNFRFIISELNMKPQVSDLFEDFNWHVNNSSSIDLYIILRRSIDQMDMETSLDLLRPQQQKMRLYQVRLDACQFLSTTHNNRIFNLMAESLHRGSNVAIKCPLQSHFNYTLSKVHLEETDFPQYVPACQFKFLTKFFMHRKYIMLLIIGGRVEKMN